MSLQDLVKVASDKTNFNKPNDYIDFACRFLEWSNNGLQAVIVCQNESNYQFWQYKEDGYFNITRPINSDILMTLAELDAFKQEFKSLISSAQYIKESDIQSRAKICRMVYTLQQAIGSTLDALPAGESNRARKVNGDLFERLVRLILISLGVNCTSGVMSIPVIVDGEEQCKMSYQHDLIIKNSDKVKAMGSVKTSSKDRIDKIFIDKFW